MDARPAPRDARRSLRLPEELSARWHRGHRVIPVQVLDASLHGFLLGTDEPFDVGYVMELEILLPEGPASVLVTSRYVGRTRYGPGIGTSILVATPEDVARWVAHYQGLAARARRLRAEPGAAHVLRASPAP